MDAIEVQQVLQSAWSLEYLACNWSSGRISSTYDWFHHMIAALLSMGWYWIYSACTSSFIGIYYINPLSPTSCLQFVDQKCWEHDNDLIQVYHPVYQLRDGPISLSNWLSLSLWYLVVVTCKRDAAIWYYSIKLDYFMNSNLCNSSSHEQISEFNPR